MKCQNKKCNKEHDGSFGSGKYCSRSCANSRIHSKITKNKIQKSINIYFNSCEKKKKTCNSCGKNLDRNGKYCSICHKYVFNRKLFDKLNIKQLNLQQANLEAVDKLKELYFEKKMSSLEIYEKFKIKENTLFFFFKKNNIRLRNFSKSITNAIKTGRAKPINNFHSISYKQGWHKTWFGQDVYLRSSYEKKIANHLDNLKIYYEVETKRIPYIYKNEEHFYIPDFWIPDWNSLIEPKNNYLYERDKDKIKIIIKEVEKKGYIMFLLIDNMVDKFIKE
jgi:hypothetical protein